MKIVLYNDKDEKFVTDTGIAILMVNVKGFPRVGSLLTPIDHHSYMAHNISDECNYCN